MLVICLRHKSCITAVFQTSCGQQERNPCWMLNMWYIYLAVENVRISVWTIQQGGLLLLLLFDYNMVGSIDRLLFTSTINWEEKFYRETSTVSLDLKTQPVVPSEKNGKRKSTLGGNKGCRTLHPYFGSTVEGVHKPTKISHEVACHKQSSSCEVLKMCDTYLAELFISIISVAEGNQCPQLSLWSVWTTPPCNYHCQNLQKCQGHTRPCHSVPPNHTHRRIMWQC